MTAAPGEGLAVTAAPGAAKAPSGPNRIEGFADAWGALEDAGLIYIAGWIDPAWQQEADRRVSIVSGHGACNGVVMAGFFAREDLGRRGTGFVALLDGTPPPGELSHVDLTLGDSPRRLRAPAGLAPLYGLAAREQLGRLLSRLAPGASAEAMRARLRALRPGQGLIECFGYHGGAGGYFLAGRLAAPAPPGAAQNGAAQDGPSVQLSLGGIGLAAQARLVLGQAGAAGEERGFVAFVPLPRQADAVPLDATLQDGGALWRLAPAEGLRPLPAERLPAALRPLIDAAGAEAGHRRMAGLLARPGFSGTENIARLAPALRMDFDEVIDCGPAGLLLLGWMLARPGTLAGLRVSVGGVYHEADFSRFSVPMERPDVIDNLGRAVGFEDPRCGFVLRVPAATGPGAGHVISDALHVEVETADGQVGYRRLPPPRLSGVAAMKRLLNAVELTHVPIAGTMAQVIAPVMAALNDARLSGTPAPVITDFGVLPAAPRISVIVPLYGRMDFLELQMALFAQHGLPADIECLYVLDDPPRARELAVLANAVHARFGVPFRVLALPENLGFAPANNVALAAARGEYVCFLNSDVFPVTPDWAERLVARLAADPQLGAVGPLLLFEDGTVQHQGIHFAALAFLGGYAFPQHTRKGLRPDDTGGLHDVPVITGACMMMRTAEAQALGGFDPAYVIGDFEDSDLCLKLRARGLRVAVDGDLRMHHLERKSQAGSANRWRVNLTAYNAYVHEQRWRGVIDANHLLG